MKKVSGINIINLKDNLMELMFSSISSMPINSTIKVSLEYEDISEIIATFTKTISEEKIVENYDEFIMQIATDEQVHALAPSYSVPSYDEFREGLFPEFEDCCEIISVYNEIEIPDNCKYRIVIQSEK